MVKAKKLAMTIPSLVELGFEGEIVLPAPLFAGLTANSLALGRHKL
jgi:hypothetical protein